MVMTYDWRINPIHWEEPQLDMFYLTYGPYAKIDIIIKGFTKDKRGVTRAIVDDVLIEL